MQKRLRPNNRLIASRYREPIHEHGCIPCRSHRYLARLVVITDVVELTNLFYGGTVPLLAPEVLPQDAAEHGPPDARQLLTSHLLLALKPRLPPQVAALLAMTPRDLTPGEGWNYVFGMASLVDRVGVWSLARLAEARTPRSVLLRRAASVAIHETTMSRCAHALEGAR